MKYVGIKRVYIIHGIMYIETRWISPVNEQTFLCLLILNRPLKKEIIFSKNLRKSLSFNNITYGQTFCDLLTHLHLLYRIFHEIRINKCNFFLVNSVILGIF